MSVLTAITLSNHADASLRFADSPSRGGRSANRLVTRVDLCTARLNRSSRLCRRRVGGDLGGPGPARRTAGKRYSTVRRNVRNPPLHPPRQNESPIHIKQIAALTESTYSRRAREAASPLDVSTAHSMPVSVRRGGLPAARMPKPSDRHMSPPQEIRLTGPRPARRGSFVAPRIGAYLPHRPSPGTPRRGVGSTAPEPVLENYACESRITIA